MGGADLHAQARPRRPESAVTPPAGSPRRGQDLGPGVLAGARPQTLPALAGLVLVAFVVVEGLLLALGLLVTRVLAHGAVHRDETAFEREVLAYRTPVLDHLTHGGTVLGATTTVIALTAVGCLVLARRGHGPRLPAFLVLAVAGETVLFVLASLVLHRMRPPIPHLDPRAPHLELPVRPHRRDGRTVGRPRARAGPDPARAPTPRPGGHGRGAAPAVRARKSALPRHALAHRRTGERAVHDGLAAAARHPAADPVLCGGCAGRVTPSIR